MTLEEQKELAKEYLAKTDYTMLSDVAIDNKEFFIGYRSFLRDVMHSSELIGSIPYPPDPEWTQPEETPAE